MNARTLLPLPLLLCTQLCAQQGTGADGDGHLWHYDQEHMPLNMHQAGTELEMATWKMGTAALLVGFGYGAEHIFARYTDSDGPKGVRYVSLGCAVYFGGRGFAHAISASRWLQVLPDPSQYEPKFREP